MPKITTQISTVETTWTARGDARYRVELFHRGLNKHRIIQSTDLPVLQRKAELQVDEWDKQWQKVEKKEHDQLSKEQNKAIAARRTAEAEAELRRLNQLLEATLDIDDTIDWEQLKDTRKFSDPPPLEPNLPTPPRPSERPRKPKSDDKEYQPQLGLLGRLLSSRREEILKACERRFATDHKRWQETVDALKLEDSAAKERHTEAVNELKAKFEVATKEWQQRRDEFLQKQQEDNLSIEHKHEAYMRKDPEAVSEYCDMVLSASNYPEYFPQEFDLEYLPETSIIAVDYALPSPDNLPTLRDVKFVASRNELVEHDLSMAQINKIYDKVIYEIALRTIHELFEADVADALTAVAFNGIVTSVDRRTGNDTTACIISLQVTKEEFSEIDLARVDPKACFKALKGVGSSKLHSLTAIAPILSLRRDDGRFISAHEVAETLGDSTNLASMDWEEFEHLIREIFEKEFQAGGGEVKVTQASRDGGVDAVAFDPDPIRGGKIVIQAKRYTNTVGVAAVRDLYGTVMNEGATKGILVTTSDYGPDAYQFASDKPLTLMNGANLLHLLQTHGFKARIDIQEARRTALDLSPNPND